MFISLRPFVRFAAFLAFAAVCVAQSTTPGAPSGVPVVQQIPDQDTTWTFYRHDQMMFLSVSATNAPTNFSATGLPPGVVLNVDTYNGNTTAQFAWTYFPLTGGKFQVTVTASNAFGTSAPMTFLWTIHPGMNYFLSTDKRSYNAGELITFTAKFSAPVFVTGTPYIPLWGTKRANYVSGSGTSTLTFTYQLASDDPGASNLYYDTITAGDGTIQTADGVSASLKDTYVGIDGLPTFSVAAWGTPAVSPATIEGTVGTPITPVQLQATNSPTSFTAYTNLGTWGLQMSSSGLITGTPTQAANNVGAWVYATNSVGQSAFTTIGINIKQPTGVPPSIATTDWPGRLPDDWLHRMQTAVVGYDFQYQVVAQFSPKSYSAQGLPPGLTIDPTTGLISGKPTAAGTYSITLVADNANGRGSASVSLTVQPAPTAAPVIQPIADRDTVQPDPNGSPVVNPGDYVDPSLPGFVRVPINASNYPSSITISPAIVVVGPPSEGYFQYAPRFIDPGRYTFTVTATNAIGSSSTTFHWVSHPAILGGPQLPSWPTTFHAGDVLSIGYNFNGPVVVTGAPYVVLHNGAHANYASGSGTTRLIFTYTIQPGEGTYTAPAPMAIELNGGSIASADGITAKVTTAEYPETYSVDAPAPSGGTPPPTNNPPPATNPPPTNNPPPSSSPKSDQTITFSSPTGAVMVGQPIMLGATSSAGLPITYSVVSGDATVAGNVLTPTSTATLIVRAASAGNDAYNAASTDVNFGNPQKAAQAVSFATSGGGVPAEQPITLSATASSGLPVTYAIVSGPATLSGNTLTFTGTGTVVVRASQAGDGAYAAANDATLTFTANPIDRLVNLSSRLTVGPDANHIGIAGFHVGSSTAKPVLIRAVGPGLSAFNVNDPAAAPQLELLDSTGKVIASNSGWNNDAQIAAASQSLGAFPLASGSKDAALLVTLAPGLYTAKVTAPATGEVLIEVYDASATAAVPTEQLVNLSTRGYVDAGTSLIGGFAVNGAQSKHVLIRAVGPGLSGFGVSGALADPVVKVYDASGTVIAQNDDWETAQTVGGGQTPATAAQITSADAATGAFGLVSGSKDAAVVLTLPAGTYSAVITGAHGTAGTALVEIYEIP